MAFLSDFYRTLADTLIEIENLGLGHWALQQDNPADDPSIQEYKNLFPHITHLLMLFQGNQRIELESQITRENIVVLLKIPALKHGEMEDAQNKIKDPKGPLSVDTDGRGLTARLLLQREEPEKGIAEDLCERFGLTHGECREFLKQSFQEIQKKSALLPELYRQKNLRELHRIFHSIKGTAMNLGLEELRLKSFKLEEISRDSLIKREELEKFLIITQNISETLAP